VPGNRPATPANTRQHSATPGNTRQHSATPGNTRHHPEGTRQNPGTPGCLAQGRHFPPHSTSRLAVDFFTVTEWLEAVAFKSKESMKSFAW